MGNSCCGKLGVQERNRFRAVGIVATNATLLMSGHQSQHEGRESWCDVVTRSTSLPLPENCTPRADKDTRGRRFVLPSRSHQNSLQAALPVLPEGESLVQAMPSNIISNSTRVRLIATPFHVATTAATPSQGDITIQSNSSSLRQIGSDDSSGEQQQQQQQMVLFAGSPLEGASLRMWDPHDETSDFTPSVSLLKCTASNGTKISSVSFSTAVTVFQDDPREPHSSPHNAAAGVDAQSLLFDLAIALMQLSTSSESSLDDFLQDMEAAAENCQDDEIPPETSPLDESDFARCVDKREIGDDDDFAEDLFETLSPNIVSPRSGEQVPVAISTTRNPFVACVNDVCEDPLSDREVTSPRPQNAFCDDEKSLSTVMISSRRPDASDRDDADVSGSASVVFEVVPLASLNSHHSQFAKALGRK